MIEPATTQTILGQTIHVHMYLKRDLREVQTWFLTTVRTENSPTSSRTRRKRERCDLGARGEDGRGEAVGGCGSGRSLRERVFTL